MQTTKNPRTVKLLMWELTSSLADRLFALSNLVLIIGAAAVLIGTIGAILMAGIREQFSNERISVNERATAEANDRARASELALAEFKAPRTFSPAQLAAIGAAISAHRDISLDIFLASNSLDVPSLSQTLAETLRQSANWSPLTWTWTGVGPLTNAVILLRENASATNMGAAAALSRVLAGTPMPAHVEIWPGDWAQFPGMLNGPPFASERTEIRLVVGSKPQ